MVIDMYVYSLLGWTVLSTFKNSKGVTIFDNNRIELSIVYTEVHNVL